MNRKLLLNVLRIVVSVGLIAYVCSKIQLDDALVRAGGNPKKPDYVGRLIAGEKGPEQFGLKTRGGDVVHLSAAQLLRDADGRLIGVQRGIVTVFSDLDLRWFVPAFLVVGLVPTIGAVRFRWLLAVQGVHITLGRSFALTFLGNFFNNFMLGLTGGDVVKAYSVARETHKRTEAVITVFLDRIVGLVALVLLAALMVAANIRDPKFAGAALYVWIFLIGAIFIALTLYSRWLRHKVHYTIFGVLAVGGSFILWWRAREKGWDGVQLETYALVALLAVAGLFAFVRPLRLLFQLDKFRMWLARNKMVREMDATFSTFSRAPRTSVFALIISVACHVTTIVGIYGYARALGISQVPFNYYLVFVPVIVMIAAMPVSLAGWGVQEAVFQVFFGTVGVNATEAVTMSFVYRLCYGILWSLPGGVVMMLSKERTSPAEAAEAVEEAQGDL